MRSDFHVTARAVLCCFGFFLAGAGVSSTAHAAERTAAKSGPVVVALNETQAQAIKIETLGERAFGQEKEAVGTVDFDEDKAVQVFPPYQGKIIAAFLKLGDDVALNQPLYTIDSPELVQAESTLIGAAATRDLTTAALARARRLYDPKAPDEQALAQKDYEQAVSDQMSAEGAYRAARDALLIFGKTPTEADRIVAERKVDRALIVRSPVAGRITARNAQPGLFVQPGTTPAPYTVADRSSLWLLANVSELNAPLVRVGQSVKVTVMAYPDRSFDGEITRLAASVDPTLHTRTARVEVQDPAHELLPNMVATFRIQVGKPQRFPALPVNGLVRQGDGTLTAWVTTDRRHFTQRIVKVGSQQGDAWQIIEGLTVGDLVVTDGAILLDNMASGGAPS